MRFNLVMALILCMTALPLFECLCCDDILNPSDCCHTESESDQKASHPCLDSLDSYSSIDSLNICEPLFVEILRLSPNDQVRGFDHCSALKSLAKHAPPIRTHLILGIQLT